MYLFLKLILNSFIIYILLNLLCFNTITKSLLSQSYDQYNDTEYENRFFDQRSNSLHEFNRGIKSKELSKPSNQTLELRPNEVYNQPKQNNFELIPENYY